MAYVSIDDTVRIMESKNEDQGEDTNELYKSFSTDTDLETEENFGISEIYSLITLDL